MGIPFGSGPIGNTDHFVDFNKMVANDEARGAWPHQA
jgi:hypothetical protein